jgi:hypothetical protein
MTGRRLAFVVLGLSVFSVVASLTVLAGFYPGNVIVLGVGVVLLASALVGLQLSFWREGEVRNRATVGTVDPPAVLRTAPLELRNPQQRVVWENLEESRRLMAFKEKEERERELREEKRRLGLSPEEEILLMAEPSWFSFWPIPILAALSFLASGLAADFYISFSCLTFGLAGLLLCVVAKHRSRYYLTNLRVLVRKRGILGGRVRWSSLSYSDIHSYSLEREFGRETLKLQGNGVDVHIKGLAAASFVTASGILRQNLPVSVQS